MPVCWFCYKETDIVYHPECSKKFFGNPTVPELQLDDKLLQELAEKNINQRIAVTGVQPKLSVTLEKATTGKDRLTIVGLWGEYILKPQQEQYPYMPETEDLTMHLASAFKIPVCDHSLMRATDDSLVYLAKRFDRNKGRKIHMEDFCQLMEFPTENKYKGSYEKGGKLVLNYCTNKGLEALSYFELILFSYLSGNNDMHLKNFSLLYKGDTVSLSPAYDLLNVTLINPKDKEELGLYLNGKKYRIKKTDFLVLGKSLNIPDKVMENTFIRFAAQNQKVLNLINSSFLGEKEKEKYQEIWLSRQKLLAE
ncbi:HipA domain-containing protein [Flavitalea flava]